jgi:hypothetical protein
MNYDFNDLLNKKNYALLLEYKIIEIYQEKAGFDFKARISSEELKIILEHHYQLLADLAVIMQRIIR